MRFSDSLDGVQQHIHRVISMSMIAARRRPPDFIIPRHQKLLISLTADQRPRKIDADSGVAGVFGKRVDKVSRRRHHYHIFKSRHMRQLRGEKIGFRLKQREINDVRPTGGDLGQDGRHIGISLVDRALKDDLAAQFGKGIRHDPDRAFSIRIAVVDSGQGADFQRADRELGRQSAKKEVVVAGAEIARQMRAALANIVIGQAGRCV